MSWFWRMPSMLARSLMRDVAAAVVTAQASIASAASAIRDVPSISCSPRGWTKERLPFACQRVRLAKSLRKRRNGRGGGPARRARLAVAAILAGLASAFLPPINHNGPLLPHARPRTQRNGHLLGAGAGRGAASAERHLYRV